MRFNSSTLNIDDLEVFVIRKKIKNLYLSVTKDGAIKVTVPTRTSYTDISNFVLAKKSWLLKQQEKVQDYTEQTKNNYITGEVYYYLGEPYILEVVNQPYDSSDGPVHLCGTSIRLNIDNNRNLLQPRYLLTKWYQQQLRLSADKLFAKWQVIIGVEFSSYSTGFLKTRWGSCHPSKKHIWLNVNLIKLPLNCLEYIIVHELVHLLEASHNHRFKALMDKYLPDWRRVKQELNSFVLQHDLGVDV